MRNRDFRDFMGFPPDSKNKERITLNMTGRERITLNMTGREALKVMAENNHGALQVLMLSMAQGALIDPDSAFGPLSMMLSLDSNDVRGSRIWMLYKDVCKENLSHAIGLLRAVQLGFCSKQDLNHAINTYGQGIDVPALISKVQNQLPNFKLTVNE